MKIQWKKYLGYLVSPTFIGILITASSVRLTIHYYELAAHSSQANQEQGLTGLLYIAHQKSIDYRLHLRGPRPVSPNLALLTVDERAVQTVGRWPWPREILGKAIDNAFNYGAKLIAFDMVFSEPSLNPAEILLAQMNHDGVHTDGVAQTLQSYVDKMDSDKSLAAAFSRHADHIVAGAFFNANLSATWPPETEFCHDMIYKSTAAAKLWDHEEILLSVNDPFIPYMPSALGPIFQSVLQEQESQMREKAGKPKNRNEQVELDAQIQEKLHSACDTILEDFRDNFNEAWKSAILAKENPKEFKFQTYDAWLEDYRRRSVPNGIPYAEDWVLNTPVIAQVTKHTGYFNTEQDPDGTIRSKALIKRTGSSYFPGLPLKTYLVANGFNATPKLELNPVTQQKEISDIEITNNDTGDVVFHLPTDRQGKLLINYAGPAQMFPYFSFADLLSDSPDAEVEQLVRNPTSGEWEHKVLKVKKAEFLKNKILVAGATATGIYDLRVTPFQENFPGTETHLNALDNMVQRNFFRTLPDERVYMPLVLAVLGLTLSVALSQLGAVAGLGLTIFTLFGTGLYDQHFLFKHGIVVSIIWPIFLTCALFVTLTFYRYFTEERGKKELRQTFQKYVSPAIVEEILAHPANIELGGRKARLTVFFSDVRGFTTISEKLDPKALSDLLNSYLTPMTEIVFKNRGTLDKYMGDAVMAFFGAPIAYPDHAKWACRCALQSLEKLFELQKEYEKKGLPSLDIGIGLNTGDVNVGNMGSQTVRSYTVMGDAVNLASRLEGINKQYGTRIVLSEFTYEDVKDSFLCREIDLVRVKGKVKPVKIYELMSEIKGAASPPESVQIFAKGYELFHARSWSEALGCFSRVLELNPADQVAQLYVQRCQDYLAEPPEADWDGVFVMKTK